MMNAPRERSHMIRDEERHLAPKEVWLDFSVWPDGTINWEDYDDTPPAEGLVRSKVRYVRVDGNDLNTSEEPE